jgi:hypothetical protein
MVLWTIPESCIVLITAILAGLIDLSEIDRIAAIIILF